MEVKDHPWKEMSKRFNHILLPKSIRGMIVGKFDCGKITPLMNLLLWPGSLHYNNLKIVGKSLLQPEYRIINKASEEKLPKGKIIRLFAYQNDVMKLQISPISVVEEIEKGIMHMSNIECKSF